jgi:hypothetical protein
LINGSYSQVFKYSANSSGLYLTVCALANCTFDILVDVCSLLLSSSSYGCSFLNYNSVCIMGCSLDGKWSQHKKCVIKLLFAEIESGKTMSRWRVLLHSLQLQNLRVWLTMYKSVLCCHMPCCILKTISSTKSL